MKSFSLLSILSLLFFSACEAPQSSPAPASTPAVSVTVSPSPIATSIPTETPVLTPTPSTTVAPSPSNDWITYKNDTCQFSFQYPKNLSIHENKNGPEEKITLETSGNCAKKDGYCPAQKIEMKCSYNQGGVTMKDWESGMVGTFEKTGNIKIGGQNATVYTPKETEAYGTKYLFPSKSTLSNGTPQHIFDVIIYSGIEKSTAEKVLNSFTFNQ